MTKQRKTFDTSLKLEVVRMITDQGLSVQNVSQTMDIGPTAIRIYPNKRFITPFCDIAAASRI